MVAPFRLSANVTQLCALADSGSSGTLWWPKSLAQWPPGGCQEPTRRPSTPSHVRSVVPARPSCPAPSPPQMIFHTFLRNSPSSPGPPSHLPPPIVDWMEERVKVFADTKLALANVAMLAHPLPNRPHYGRIRLCCRWGARAVCRRHLAAPRLLQPAAPIGSSSVSSWLCVTSVFCWREAHSRPLWTISH